MIGIGDREYLALRFAAFAREVLAPQVHPQHHAVEAAVFQSAERVSFDVARAAQYSVVAPGFRWGPVWSTAWFRVRATVPASMDGRPVALRFSSGTEALLWRDRVPVAGLDENHTAVTVRPAATGGETLELWVEAACNRHHGASTFWWDDAEVHARWAEERPGRLDFCELVTVDDAAWRFVQRYDMARELALALPEGSARATRLLQGLRDLSNAIPAAAPRPAMEALASQLDALLVGSPAPDTTCFAVGHGHLDTGWLWPIRETRRKLLRTFSSVLRLMERFPRFRFVASQAQQYAFLEEESPALFEEVRARVAEGRFEAAGAMWVEPDTQVPSGESLVRQILYGVRYFRERFGADLPQRVLFLPDTFGFPACLPQIMQAAGLDTFVTNKMSWCERNAFPFTTFRWRGIDGTEVLSHFTPGDNYNAPLRPEDLLHGERKMLRQDHRLVGHAHRGTDVWLQPYGFGDGGGGPNDVTAMRAELAASVEGLPRVQQAGLHEFRAALHARHTELRAAGHDLPVWDGELYLELHRGTFTSQAWLKQANADAERGLREVEALLVLANDAGRTASVMPELQDAWRKVLLHQFHDILPGTSIGAVYDEARADHAAVAGCIARLRDRLLEQVAGSLPAPAAGDVVVFNPCSHSRTGWLPVEPAASDPPTSARTPWCHADALPPLSAALLATHDSPPPTQAVQVSDRVLQNEHLRVTLDDAGRIAELRCKELDGELHAIEAGARVPLNQLVLDEDRPRRWEAWDLDFDHEDKATVLDTPADAIAIEESGPFRGTLAVTRRLGDSVLVQRYRLTAGARRLEVANEIDWQEECTLLRAVFPTGVRARHATYGIQFGAIERPTHRNTAFDEARFEVPGHRWMDLSQPGLGLAILDDGKFGRSCRDHVLGLSLLRGPRFPDPDADRGAHRFTYALYPHAGDWRAADVPAQADELQPVHAVQRSSPRGVGTPAPVSRDATSPALAPFAIETVSGAAPGIAAWKPAEDGNGAILRLVERHGGRAKWHLRWPAAVVVEAVDLLESPVSVQPPFEVDHDGTDTHLTATPYQITSLRIVAP